MKKIYLATQNKHKVAEINEIMQSLDIEIEDLSSFGELSDAIEDGLTFLENAKKTLRKGGCLMLKDWVRTPTPIHWMAWFSDRFITGDKVFYYTDIGLRDMIRGVFGRDSIRYEARIRPWQNNIMFVIRG